MINLLGKTLTNTNQLPIKVDQFFIALKDSKPVNIEVFQDKVGDISTSTYIPNYIKDNYPIILKGCNETLFKYKVTGLSPYQIDDINSLNAYDISGKLQLIEEYKGSLEYHCIKNEIFSENIDSIDSVLDKIIAYTLIYHYCDKLSYIPDLINQLNKDNPLNYHGNKTYMIRIRNLLLACLLGMRPGVNWIEHHPVIYGYQVPYQNGDEFSFVLDDRNVFQNLFVNSCRLNTPDPVKCDYGYIYSEGEDSFLDLGLEISLIN